MYFFLKNIVSRLIAKGLFPHFPPQLTINYYEPDEGLMSHTDNVDVIKEWIVGISLLSSCLIYFTNRDGFVREYFLHPGSVMIQSGEARYEWKHGISAEPIHRHENISVSRSYRISLQLSSFDESYFSHPDTQKYKI
jgi:alkylated DNA repair dioxygenase AlkB